MLRVQVAANGLSWSRIASAVPRRHGKAVLRNRLRRLYRDAFRFEKESLPAGYDIVVSPARGSLAPTLEAVRGSLVRCVGKVVARLERKQEKEKQKGKPKEENLG